MLLRLSVNIHGEGKQVWLCDKMLEISSKPYQDFFNFEGGLNWG
jgi:hypothetical protein